MDEFKLSLGYTDRQNLKLTNVDGQLTHRLSYALTEPKDSLNDSNENLFWFIFYVFFCLKKVNIEKYRFLFYKFTYSIFFFVLDFGLSWLTSLQFIQYNVAGFYKPTIPQSPPSHLQDYSTCNNARLESSTIFVPSFDPNEWCLKNGLHSGGLNPGPLGHESSALTTGPRLLTNSPTVFIWIVVKVYRF